MESMNNFACAEKETLDSMSTRKARVTVEKAYTIGEVDQKIFGSFVEHLGRCVYKDVYKRQEPDVSKRYWINKMSM